jgi:hypothetical protein
MGFAGRGDIRTTRLSRMLLSHTQHPRSLFIMRFSVLAFTGLCAASPALVARQNGRVDVSGSYWNVTISTKSGRPGYLIRDLSTIFHNPKFEQTVDAKCHYSFVPQGTSPPAETDQCDTGLQYTWDCTFSQLHLPSLLFVETPPICTYER